MKQKFTLFQNIVEELTGFFTSPCCIMHFEFFNFVHSTKKDSTFGIKWDIFRQNWLKRVAVLDFVTSRLQIKDNMQYIDQK